MQRMASGRALTRVHISGSPAQPARLCAAGRGQLGACGEHTPRRMMARASMHKPASSLLLRERPPGAFYALASRFPQRPLPFCTWTCTGTGRCTLAGRTQPPAERAPRHAQPRRSAARRPLYLASAHIAAEAALQALMLLHARTR
jgi:hypothetical protein